MLIGYARVSTDDQNPDMQVDDLEKAECKEIFIDKVVRVSFRDKKSSLAIDNDEIEANQFAAELLMPRDLVRQEINNLLERGRSVFGKDWLIEKLAPVFDVSSQSMEFRLNNLGILVSSYS